MSRIFSLIGQPKRTLAALAVASLAVAVAVGSGATFSSQSTNPGNAFSTGILKQSNTGDNAAVATLSNMLPGEEQSGQITLASDGTRAGTMKFVKTQSSTAGTDSEACSGEDGGTATCSKLEDALKVDVTDGADTVYTGLAKNIAISDFNLAASGAGSSRTLGFRFYLPSDTGNAFQGGTYSASYTWNFVQ